jgi:hypothetical protein
MRRLQTARRYVLYGAAAAAAVAVCSSTLWIALALSWIKQRHEAAETVVDRENGAAPVTAPGGLWLLGEEGVYQVVCLSDSRGTIDRVQRLFPESKIVAAYLPTKNQVQDELHDSRGMPIVPVPTPSPFNERKWFKLPVDGTSSAWSRPIEWSLNGTYHFDFFAPRRLADEVEVVINYLALPGALPSSNVKLVQVVRQSYLDRASGQLVPMPRQHVALHQGYEPAAYVMVRDRNSPAYGWGVDRFWGEGVHSPTIFFNDDQSPRYSVATGKMVIPQAGRIDEAGLPTGPAVMIDPTSLPGGTPQTLDFIVGAYCQSGREGRWLSYIRWGVGDDNAFFNTRYAYVEHETDEAPTEFREALREFLSKYPDPRIQLP